MNETCPVQTLDSLRRALAEKRALGIAWRDIALSYPPVPPGTLCAILKGRKPPKRYRRALGLVRLRQPGTRQIIPGIWAAGGKPVYTDCVVPLMELVAAARRLNFTQRK